MAASKEETLKDVEKSFFKFIDTRAEISTHKNVLTDYAIRLGMARKQSASIENVADWVNGYMCAVKRMGISLDNVPVETGSTND